MQEKRVAATTAGKLRFPVPERARDAGHEYSSVTVDHCSYRIDERKEATVGVRRSDQVSVTRSTSRSQFANHIVDSVRRRQLDDRAWVPIPSVVDKARVQGLEARSRVGPIRKPSIPLRPDEERREPDLVIASGGRSGLHPQSLRFAVAPFHVPDGRAARNAVATSADRKDRWTPSEPQGYGREAGRSGKRREGAVPRLGVPRARDAG